MENIKINVSENIGSKDRPTKDTDMVAAYGLTHHFGNVAYDKNSLNTKTWDELHNKNNPSVLKNAGHITNLAISVGGNILAYGHNAGYSAGIGQDMSSAWMENINVDIKGDIITDLLGNSAQMNISRSTSYAFGLSDELMNLTDSYLSVNNIIFKGTNLPESFSNINMIGAVANNNSHGNYINIKNNTIKVKGNIEGSSNTNLLSSIGFNNDFDALGQNGVNWVHESENNTYEIGGVILKSNKLVQYQTLGSKWRTGQNPIGNLKLPEASLKNSKVKLGNINIEADKAYVSLLMFNSSNAKNNTLDYGNIDIKAKETNFYAMGNLQNSKPTTNYYENITENNHITVKDINIESDEAPYVSLMAGYQDTDQKMKNCSIKAFNINLKINKADKTSFISGIAGYSLSDIDSCRVFVDSINVDSNTNSQNGKIYFGLGAGYQKNAKISNSGVFVNENIKLNGPNLYAGGFIGYGNSSTLTNNDFQIDGVHSINGNGYYGGFAGLLKNSKLEKNSSLILNDFMPFIYNASNNTNIDKIAHYVNGKAPKFFSGLVSGGDSSAKITNSTLLVEKAFEDTILYPKNFVSTESEDNYLVIVDNNNKYNRTSYKTAETNSTVDEMGAVIPVIKKMGESIGKINIQKRSFQNDYWNKSNNSYEITEAEKDFVYMNANDAGTISAFGVDNDKIISSNGTKGKLYDYYHRHAGLVNDKGIVYDLLGIKGSVNFMVIYDGNGNDSGTVPTDSTKYNKNESVTVLDKGDLNRKGYKFLGWNTKADGSGKMYQANDSFIIIEDTTLYAQWEKIEEPPKPIEPDKPSIPSEPSDYTKTFPVKASVLNRIDHYQYLIGYEDKTFRPENNMTRQEVTVMFSRLLENRPEKGRIYSRDYKDTPDSLWSITGISYMSMLNIIKGYPDGNFKPFNSITRAEFAAIASRFDNLSSGNKTFTDVSKDHWAYEEIQKAAEAAWIFGYPDGTFKPDKAITRAEVVSITNRMLNRYADEDYVKSHKNEILNFTDIDASHWAYYPVVEATNGHDFERKSNGKDELWHNINEKSFVYDK